MFNSFNVLFKNNCLYYPKFPALSYQDKTYSYESLNQHTNQLAHYLKSKGIKKGTVIAVISKNYLERIVGVISLWKLGAAYLPIDPNYPLTRINYIINDSQVDFVMTDNEIFENISSCRTLVPIFLDDNEKNKQQMTPFPMEDLPDCSEYSDIAYIAYTSGSTGDPKGAMITQGNISGMYQAWEHVYKLTCHDRHLQLANFGFDVCSGDIIRALGSGAHLIMCSSEVVLQPDKFYKLLTEVTITVAEFTPVVLRRLIAYLEQQDMNLRFMRLLICGSDSWSLKEYKHFRSFLNPEARLINSYGTTETTIDSTYFEMNDKTFLFFDEQLSVPLGRPFPNTTIRILNKKFEDCSPGIPGELYIGGTGVSAGYLNQPKLTKEKFITFPSKEGNCIFYKTGDLGSYLPDGNISFLGRADYQTKIMGYRVGLLEVENVLNRYPGIQKAVLVVHSTLGSQEKFLVAFIMHNGNFEINDYIAFLKKHLAMYTIPVFYFCIPSFPISDHGKLDRLKLSSMLVCKDGSDCFKNRFNQKWANEGEAKRKLLRILKNTFNTHIINSSNFFFSLDTNSLLCAKFLMEIEIEFNFKLVPEDFMMIHSVDILSEVLEKKLTSFFIKG